MLLAAILSLASIPQSPAPGESPTRFLDHFLEAEAALESGDVARATTLLEQCLTLLPGNANATYELACAQARAGERDASLATLERAVAAGFDDAALARWDCDLESLHGDQRFESLLRRIPRDTAQGPTGELTTSAGLGVTEPSFHSSGLQMALGCTDGSVRIFDIANAQPVRDWRASAESIEACLWIADGSRILTQDRLGSTRLWDSSNGRLVADLGPGARLPRSRWFAPLLSSPDGRRVLLFGPALEGSLIDSRDGTRIAALEPADKNASLAVLSRDCQRVAMAADDGSIWLWDATTGKRLAFQAQMGSPPVAIDISPDNTMIAASPERGEMILWLIATDTRICEHRSEEWFDPGSQVRRLRFSPDSRSVLFSSGNCGIVARFDIATESELWHWSANGGNGSAIEIAFDDSGRRVLFAGMRRGLAHVLDASDGKDLADLELLGLGALGAAPGGRFLVGSPFTGLVVLDGASFEPLYKYTPFENGGWLVATSRPACDGSSDILSATSVAIGASTWPLESFGSVVVDRKRVRAAAAGVELRRPRLHMPPTLTVESPATSVATIDGGETELEITAADPNGLAGIELDTGAGGSAARYFPIAPGPDGKPPTESKMSLSVETTGPRTDALVRAVGVSGLSSRIARVAFVRPVDEKR